MRRHATALFALLTAVQLTAAVPPTKKQPRRPSSASLTVGAPFDPSFTALPPHFRANNFVALYRKLSIDPKREFETTNDFTRRVSAVPTAVYAFDVPNVAFHYNADEQSFAATFNTDFVHTGWTLQVEQSLLLLYESRTETGRYIGSNAFGASAAVTRVTNRKWGVLLARRGFETIRLEFHADLDQARILKNNLAVLVVCQVGPQSVPARMTGEGAEMRNATGFDISGATIDAPTDLSVYYYAVTADVRGFWLYAKQSGKVLAKFSQDGSLVDDAHATAAPAVSATQRLLEQHHLSLGMTKDQVRAVLGEPDERNEGWFGDLHGERWEYKKLHATFDFALSDSTLRAVGSHR